jgi:hypothetical protein
MASMRTVAETEIFIRYAKEVWSEAEREEFINFIAADPEAVVARFAGRELVPVNAAVRG